VRFSLSPAYPNPFNAETVFRANVPEDGEARIAVYDLTGRLIKTLHHGPVAAGVHAWRWDGENSSGETAGTGVYLLRVEYVGSFGLREATTRRVVLVK